MRLLDVRTLELKSFFDNRPPYAILSHCWEDEEVLYSDIHDLEKAKTKKGFRKIEKTCERAITDGLDFCWVDTCCIDKKSSSELSEAINSMFQWYKESDKCYAYLYDVGGPQDFEKSKWFERSWTLQELLAPSSVSSTLKSGTSSGMDFFSRDWRNLGSKGGLSSTLARVTGVDKEYLEGKSLNTASISMRMSWAADRKATRAEDIAYSLLGLFDVNMPLLYGEGKLKAFRRLQEEIMKVSEDETLFAWESTELTTEGSSADVLASDPKDFTESRQLVPFASDEPVAPYSLTHRGLRIWLQLYHFDIDLREWIRPLRSPIMIWSSNQNPVWAPLRCHVAHDFQHYVMIPLTPLMANIYSRDTTTNVARVPIIKLQASPQLKEVYIRNNRISSSSSLSQRQYGILIRRLPPEFSIGTVIPSTAWDPRSRVLQVNSVAGSRRFWHASLQLNLSAEKSLTRAKRSMYLSLGCKQDPDSEPTPTCFLDSFVYTSDDESLADFHGLGYPSIPQQVIKEPQDCDELRYNFSLTIKISPERIFGQRMFVVDVEFNGSALPVSSPQRVGGRPLSSDTNTGDASVANYGYKDVDSNPSKPAHSARIQDRLHISDIKM